MRTSFARLAKGGFCRGPREFDPCDSTTGRSPISTKSLAASEERDATWTTRFEASTAVLPESPAAAATHPRSAGSWSPSGALREFGLVLWKISRPEAELKCRHVG